MDVYLEIGSKRVFASAVDWPGWCRSGRDEGSALESLIAYGQRYRTAVKQARPDFNPPANVEQVSLVERVEGGATTDFGAPGSIPRIDRAAIADSELERAIAIHAACWAAFAKAAKRAAGRKLASGPRGGGRDLAKIRAHVAEAEAAYIAQLGGRRSGSSDDVKALQAAFVTTLRARAAGELPDRGPRGGERWPARYAVRRSAWHLLDHAWEIEDRALADR